MGLEGLWVEVACQKGADGWAVSGGLKWAKGGHEGSWMWLEPCSYGVRVGPDSCGEGPRAVGGTLQVVGGA